MPRSLSITLYLRPFSIAIYEKFDLYYLYAFFWPVNFTILVWNWCLLFQTILDSWPVSILEVFSGWDFKKGQFQFLVTFLAFFWFCKLYKSVLYIIINFEHGQCFFQRFLAFSFLVFSVFKYLKFAFLGIFSDLKMLQSVNYICKVCKLYLCLRHVRNIGQYLYLSVSSKQWMYPTFSFC